MLLVNFATVGCFRLRVALFSSAHALNEGLSAGSGPFCTGSPGAGGVDVVVAQFAPGASWPIRSPAPSCGNLLGGQPGTECA